MILFCVLVAYRFLSFGSPGGLFTPEDIFYSLEEDKGGVDNLNEKGWKTFISKDSSFKLNYPPDWKVFEDSYFSEGNAYQIPVQSWALVNFDYSEHGGVYILPADAIIMNFNIMTEGIKQSLNNYLDCGDSRLNQCENIIINGVVYKKIITEGNESKGVSLATMKNGMIYEVTGMVNSQNDKEGMGQMEEIIKTFEIIQSI